MGNPTSLYFQKRKNCLPPMSHAPGRCPKHITSMPGSHNLASNPTHPHKIELVYGKQNSERLGTQRINEIPSLSFNFISIEDVFLEDNESFLRVHWYPCFGLLVTSALGFKVRVDLSVLFFVTCMQWILQIHPQCNTC